MNLFKKHQSIQKNNQNMKYGSNDHMLQTAVNQWGKMRGEGFSSDDFLKKKK